MRILSSSTFRHQFQNRPMSTEKRTTATAKFGYVPRRGYTPTTASTVNVAALPRAPKGGTGAVAAKPVKK